VGLGYHLVEALIRESLFKPIDGDVVMIGRQTVYFTPAQFVALLQSHGVETGSLQPEHICIDSQTLNRLPGEGQSWIADTELFRILGAKRVLALDHSAYEGADIIHDLTKPVPDRLRGCADFVIDGSTLDNTFDPALTLRNYCDLLRPGGRLLAGNMYSNHNLPYVILPPHWYIDYFAMNNFADCKVYVIVFPDHRPENLLEAQKRASVFTPDIDALIAEGNFVNNFISPHMMVTIVFAQKGPDSTTDVSPIQQPYRSASDWEIYRGSLRKMQRSARHHLVRTLGELQFREGTGGYLIMAEDFSTLDRLPEPCAAPAAP